MEMSHEAWPPQGRIGFCRRGKYAGHHILVTAEETADWWTVCVNDAPTQADSEFMIKGDDMMRARWEQWAVVWAAPEDDEALEREVFDLRRTWRVGTLRRWWSRIRRARKDD